MTQDYYFKMHSNFSTFDIAIDADEVKIFSLEVPTGSICSIVLKVHPSSFSYFELWNEKSRSSFALIDKTSYVRSLKFYLGLEEVVCPCFIVRLTPYYNTVELTTSDGMSVI